VRKWPCPAATEGAPRNRAEKAAFQNTVLEHPVFLKALERGATVVWMPRLAVAREVDVRRLTSTAAEENRVKPAPAPPEVIVCALPPPRPHLEEWPRVRGNRLRDNSGSHHRCRRKGRGFAGQAWRTITGTGRATMKGDHTSSRRGSAAGGFRGRG